MESESIRIAPIRETLQEGVTLLRAEARVLPKVTVTVLAPPSLDEEEVRIQVEHASRGVIRSVGMETDHLAVLDSLPAENLDVVLSVGPWEMRRSVDLTRGADESVVFSLEPVIVEGLVTYGGDPVEADVAFGRDTRFATRTDSDGHYGIVLWQPGRYSLRVLVRSQQDVAAFLDTVRVDESRTINIEIPATRYAIHVSDGTTAEPVRGAVVNVTNDFEDEVEGARRIMSSVVADDEGHASLPPLRPGSLRVRVDAEGYATNEMTARVEKADDVVIPIRLQRLSDVQAIHCILPDGSDASSAELLAISHDDRVLYSANAASDGTIRLPRSLGEVLLVIRHPRAGGSARILGGNASRDGEMIWRLPVAAPPLRVRAQDASSRRVAGAPVFVWIDGHRVGGIALSFLGRTIPVTEPHGEWTALNLPAVSTRILVVKRLGATGRISDVDALDPYAQTVTYPWMGWVDVRAY